MSLNTTAPSYTAGQVLTAAQLNALQDGIQAPWTSYTPTTTGLTLTSGTLVGSYIRVGKTVDFFISFTFGASSAVTGGVTFSLPVTAKQSLTLSDAIAFDNSATAWYPCSGMATTTTTVTVRTLPATAGSAYVNLGASTPFTWGTNDVIVVNGCYEAA